MAFPLKIVHDLNKTQRSVKLDKVDLTVSSCHILDIVLKQNTLKNFHCRELKN